MSADCCHTDHGPAATDPRFRKALWFALIINLTMFLVEIVASEFSDSMSLKADALDFFGDSTNYAISLFVVASGVVVRARASQFKAITMLLLAGYVSYSVIVRVLSGSEPIAETMGVIGIAAFTANMVVAIVLYQFRTGDSNMQSVWLCTRNDVIGNIAVLLAAGGVVLTSSRWPDLMVALVISSLAVSSAVRILSLAAQEIRDEKSGHHESHSH